MVILIGDIGLKFKSNQSLQFRKNLVKMTKPVHFHVALEALKLAN